MADPHAGLPRSLADPFYYLANFQQVLDWVGSCHGDLLDGPERAFLEGFAQLPRASRALLVRMTMRKGTRFRTGRLRYEEIGCPLQAAGPLIELGWVDDAPRLGFEELFDLLTKDEIARAFGLPASLSKAALLARLRPQHETARPLAGYRDEHVQAIRRTFREKHGLQSPFVAWERLDEALLEQALTCIPGAHLRLFFARILRDIPANRSGLPDLVQFWPAERRYRMIEVKGPGDRLQDNQRRWLDYALAHDLPVAVCHVRWTEAGTAH